MLNFLKNEFPDIPLFCIGHSAGAQQIGLVSNNNLIDGMIAVATSAGYPPDMPLHYRLKTHIFFKIFVPISIRLTGYVAAARFGLMEDIPRQFALDWKAWCYRKDYYFDPQFYGKESHVSGVPIGNCHALPFPVSVFTASDDEISSPQNVQRFWKHLSSQVSNIRFVWYHPEDLKVNHIQHFGYFRKQFQNSIWKDILMTLENFLSCQLNQTSKQA